MKHRNNQLGRDRGVLIYVLKEVFQMIMYLILCLVFIYFSMIALTTKGITGEPFGGWLSVMVPIILLLVIISAVIDDLVFRGDMIK